MYHAASRIKRGNFRKNQASARKMSRNSSGFRRVTVLRNTLETSGNIVQVRNESRWIYSGPSGATDIALRVRELTQLTGNFDLRFQMAGRRAPLHPSRVHRGRYVYTSIPRLLEFHYKRRWRSIFKFLMASNGRESRNTP